MESAPLQAVRPALPEDASALDPEAFEALFRELYARLTAFAAQYLGSREAAEEVVQEVFLEVWVRRHHLRFREGARAYLYRAVRNRSLNVIDRGRLAGRARRLLLAEEPITQSMNPLAVDEADDLRAALARLVATLPPRTRLAVTLRYHHGLSYREAATVMGIGVKGVERLLRLAMIRLRDAIGTGRVGISRADLSLDP